MHSQSLHDMHDDLYRFEVKFLSHESHFPFLSVWPFMHIHLFSKTKEFRGHSRDLRSIELKEETTIYIKCIIIINCWIVPFVVGDMSLGCRRNFFDFFSSFFSFFFVFENFRLAFLRDFVSRSLSVMNFVGEIWIRCLSVWLSTGCRFFLWGPLSFFGVLFEFCWVLFSSVGVVSGSELIANDPSDWVHLWGC